MTIISFPGQWEITIVHHNCFRITHTRYTENLFADGAIILFNSTWRSSSSIIKKATKDNLT